MKKFIIALVATLSLVVSVSAKAPYQNVKQFKSVDLANEQFEKIKLEVSDLFMTIQEDNNTFKYVVKTNDGAVLIEVKKEAKVVTTLVTKL